MVSFLKPKKSKKRIIPLRRKCYRCKKGRVIHHHKLCDKCHKATKFYKRLVTRE